MVNYKRNFLISGIFLVCFIAFTFIVLCVGRGAVGPNGSIVGLSSFNKSYSEFIGVNLLLYKITDYVSIVPALLAFIYACMGLFQWIKRKSIKNVDADLIILGVFYIVVFGVFCLFQVLKINYRPVLIEGVLEVSYPSSTTMLSITFLASSIHMTDKYIKNETARETVKIATIIFMVFLIAGRVVSGVHWLTDIIGSILISVALIYLFYGCIYKFCDKSQAKNM